MSDYQLLLAGVARLYGKHEAGRRKPFNVFSVLRSESDEVNLHSRFLRALLKYKKSPEAERENLKDFLQHVVGEQFEEKGANVDREIDNIDILISNADSKQAVVIENKIWAGDQPEQLQKYYRKLRDPGGYSNIHLLYLTPHGNEPSKNSPGDLDYKTISYKDDLLPWLKRCQKRACDETELRESVAQYGQLVRKLTGTDFTGEYMSELKNLLLQNNNFVLARTLIKATREVQIELEKKLWGEIESEIKKLKNKIRTLPEKGSDSDISLGRIERFVKYETTNTPPGLYYPFGRSEAASLGVGVDSNIYFGVRCSKGEYPEMYNKLKEALEGVIGAPPDNDWPWCEYVNEELNLKDPTQEHLELLSNADARKNYAQEIACGLSKVWETIEGAGLAR